MNTATGKTRGKRKQCDQEEEPPASQRSSRKEVEEPPNSILRITSGFLVNLTTEAITMQTKELKRAASEGEINTSMITARTNVLHAITHTTPISNDTITLLRDYQSSVARAMCTKLTFKAEALMLNMLVWDWIESMVTKSWDTIDIKDGVGRLLKDIVDASPGPLELHASHYFGESSKQVYTIFALPRQRSAFVVQQLGVKILASWLGLPNDIFYYQARGWFVKEIIKHIGARGLRLSSVLIASNQVRVSVLGLSRNTSITYQHLTYWTKHYLLRHGICSATSEESKALDALCDLADKISPLNKDLLRVAQDASANGCVLHSGPPLNSLLFPPLPIFSTPPTLPILFEKFWKAIHTSLPMAAHDFCMPEGPSTFQGTSTHRQRSIVLQVRFVHHINKDLDNRLPDRNRTPSQKKILSSAGPYSPQHVKMVAGLFSALIYRGITHGSQFLLDHPDTIFSTLKEWQTLQNALLKRYPESHLLKPFSYGSNIKGRALNHAESYWEKANDSTLNSWLLESEEPINPVALLCLLRKAKISGLGGVILLELVFDYVKCGQATTPSADEMEEMYSLAKIKKGPVQKLKDLGFIKISTGLSAVHDELKHRLSPHVWENINGDFIFISQALRAWSMMDTSECREFLNSTL